MLQWTQKWSKIKKKNGTGEVLRVGQQTKARLKQRQTSHMAVHGCMASRRFKSRTWFRYDQYCPWLEAPSMGLHGGWMQSLNQFWKSTQNVWWKIPSPSVKSSTNVNLVRDRSCALSISRASTWSGCWVPFTLVRPTTRRILPYFIDYQWITCSNHSFNAERPRSPQFLKEKKVKFRRPRHRANLNQDHSLKNPQSIHLSYLRADECRWKKIDQIFSAATDCKSTAVASAGKARTRSFHFALFKFKYNIHLALVNIGWYLARDMARGAHRWPRRYLPRLRLGKYVDSVNHVHLGPYGTH